MGDRRQRWLRLHAGIFVLVGMLTTGVWWLAERSQGMTTPFWPGWVMLLLLIPLGLHAAIVYSAGPGRQRTEQRRLRGRPAQAAPADQRERALATVVFTDIVGSTAQARE
ncbi:MAG TPA: hypothetical protein VIJ32_12600, partial [Actinomycetes bacterium]